MTKGLNRTLLMGCFIVGSAVGAWTLTTTARNADTSTPASIGASGSRDNGSMSATPSSDDVAGWRRRAWRRRHV